LKECKVSININTHNEKEVPKIRMDFPTPLDITVEKLMPKEEIQENLLDIHLKARKLYGIVMKLNNFDYEGRILVERLAELTEKSLILADMPVPDLEVEDE
jgi:hypothetical protein